jgi:hypothetical protein
MCAGVDLVRFGRRCGNGKECQILEEEVRLLRDWLRRNCVVRVPAREISLAFPGLVYSRGLAYETLRTPCRVMRMLRTDMDSEFLRMSLPLSSAFWVSDGSP